VVAKNWRPGTSRRVVKTGIDPVDRPGAGVMQEVQLEQILSIFDAIDEKIYVADPESHEILYVNPAKRAVFGQDIVGEKCYKVFQGLDEPCDFCSNLLILGENLGKAHIWEFQNRKTGNWLRCIDRAIPWSDGRMVRFEMAIDIHDKKVAEEALRESEKKYRQLVENINEVIYSTDEKGMMTYVSPAITSLTGFSPSEIEGRHFSQLIFKDDFERIVGRFGKALLGQERPTEYRILTRTGEYRWVRTYSKPIREGDEVKGIRGVLLDITEQKRVEAALKEREKELSFKAGHLEEMNAALRVLLKTREQDKIELEEKVLLNVNQHIIPYVEKLKTYLEDGKQKAYLDILEANIKSVTSSFSRDLHFKYLKLTPTELHIAGLIREGKTTGEIADLMNLSSRTVESHRKNIRNKMGLKVVKANLRATLMSLI
jgi:PAS domain S-box-containing protein